MVWGKAPVDPQTNPPRAKNFFLVCKNVPTLNTKNMTKTTTYLLHCFIAGLQYYDVLEIWKELKIGELLELIPEPENRYDKHAVMVTYKGKQLGYLPRSENRHIAKILNAGLNPYEARIQSLYQDNPMYERVEICLKVKQQKKGKEKE